MKKQFIIADEKWPDREYHDLVLAVNEKDSGRIQIENLGTVSYPRFALCLHLWDDAWDRLPIIAADLFQHTAGAGWGYASLQAATQAAAAILTAHGWENITKGESNAGK